MPAFQNGKREVRLQVNRHDRAVTPGDHSHWYCGVAVLSGDISVGPRGVRLFPSGDRERRDQLKGYLRPNLLLSSGSRIDEQLTKQCLEVSRSAVIETINRCH
jgi:hypothetical protein